MIETLFWAAFILETLILLAVVILAIWLPARRPGEEVSNKVSGPPLPINHNPPPEKNILPTQVPKGPPPKPATRLHVTNQSDRGNTP